ncbi:MAG: ABC transporter substrate-binding protein [Patescibacteria group bacterium]
MVSKHMRRRTSVIVVLAAALAVSTGYYFLRFFRAVPVPPAVPQRVFTVGVVTNPPSLDPAWQGFRQGMQARGYEEGKNIRYIVAPGGKDLAAAKETVGRMVEQGVDAFYVMGSIGGRAAKEVTAGNTSPPPVIFGVVSNPVGGKLVASMQSSGNNLTGVTPHNEVVVSKRLEIFLEIVPETKRIIYPWSDPNTTGVQNVRASAKALGVELVEKRVADPAELTSFLASFPFRRGDAILRAADSVSGIAIKDIIALSLEKKIPVSGTNVQDTQFGALMSYGANFFKIGVQAARLADLVLKGAKPADIPIELPDALELVINLKTAEALGITIATDVMSKANEIVR